MSEAETPTFGTSENNKSTGRVKWFNNRAGYGFITVTEGDNKDEDLFVHHSAISVSSEQYKYLVEGEYINFEKITSDSTDHKFQAGNVTGVNNGQLMCETRNNARAVRNEKNGDTQHRKPSNRASRSQQVEGAQQRVYVRGSGPREGEEWYLVKGRKGVREDRTQPRQMRRGTSVKPVPTGENTLPDDM